MKRPRALPSELYKCGKEDIGQEEVTHHRAMSPRYQLSVLLRGSIVEKPKSSPPWVIRQPAEDFCMQQGDGQVDLSGVQALQPSLSSFHLQGIPKLLSGVFQGV